MGKDHSNNNNALLQSKDLTGAMLARALLYHKIHEIRLLILYVSA